MFFSLDRTLTKTQILNTKCQLKFFFLLLFPFKKRGDKAVLFSFLLKWVQKHCAKIWCLGLFNNVLCTLNRTTLLNVTTFLKLLINLHYEIRICQKIYNRVTMSNVWFDLTCIRRYLVFSQKKHNFNEIIYEKLIIELFQLYLFNVES